MPGWYPSALRYNLTALMFIPFSTEQELERAVQLYVKAFSGDPYLKAILGGNWSLLPIHGRSVFRAALLEGFVYAVKAQDLEDSNREKIVSIGLFFEPGTSIFATEAQRSLGYRDWFDRLAPEAQEWHTTVVSLQIDMRSLADIIRSLALQAPQHRKDVVEPLFTDKEKSERWWCSGLMTDPEYQRKGYAKAIIRMALDKAADNGGFVGLATVPEINVIKYKAMGFGIRATYNMPTLSGELYIYSLKISKEEFESDTTK
ncbi:hypothetical protein V5O48_005365 [Marasmius crinis-equi]|uniref:N-acetyltransferase domain-containing protein n=1 Tax=Marasmius crinis-equi TaxID=585013 RepID=A0ABR3FMI4_9AGAR